MNTISVQTDSTTGRAALALKRIFFAAFLLLVGISMVYGYLRFSEEAMTLTVVPCALAFLLLLFAAGKLTQKEQVQGWFSHHFTVFIFAAAAVYFAATLFLANICRYTPSWDMDAIFGGALNWISGSLTGGQYTTTCDIETYFYWFPNNLSDMTILAAGFRLFGTKDAFFSACILNTFFLTVMFVTVSLSMKELAGERGGVVAVAALYLNLPLWFAGAYFYTDSLSIAFPSAGFYCLLRARRAGKNWAGAAWMLASAVLFALGGYAKITALIMAIAAVIWLVLRREWKTAASLGILTAVFTAGMFGALQLAMYPSQMDRAMADQMNTPTLHWVMMGLKEDGYYNPEDYTFTRSFATTEERDTAIVQEIKRRMAEYGPLRLVKHTFRKLGHTINSGTLQMTDFYDDGPLEPEWMQQLLIHNSNSGIENYIFEMLCNAIHLCLLVLAMAGAVHQLRSKKIDIQGALWLGYFGMLLFLSVWETNPRYTVNFTGILTMCACFGLLGITEKRPRNK